MTVNINYDIEQGSLRWIEARCGLLTASEMHLIMTPTFQVASNDKARGHMYELMAQRITKIVEPHFVSDDMLRGKADEADAVDVYNRRYHRVKLAGFITNDKWGFTLGYSPDGLVGDNGLIECKSRRMKHQIRAILEYGVRDEIEADYVIQVQAGLLISEREWCDLICYSGGLPMLVVKVHPDEKIQKAIVEAASEFESRIAERLEAYNKAVVGFVPTERRKEEELFV